MPDGSEVLEPRLGPPTELRADCTNCFGLCCVALSLSASADFAIDKDAGEPCRNLQPDFRCGIHADLRGNGFPGCTVYDCFGAGQRISQVTFGGRDWRKAPETARQMFDVFTIVRHLHELLWYLNEALALPPARPLRGELQHAYAATEQLARAGPDALAELDLAAHRAEVNQLLLGVSELVRPGVGDPGKNHRAADLIGANLKGAELRGADFRGARLIGADLSQADLRLADLIGADLRAADLSGADLSDSIFLTQSQLDSAKGDAATRLPPSLSRPQHWSDRG